MSTYKRRTATVLVGLVLVLVTLTAPAKAAEAPANLTAEAGIEVVHLQWEYSSLISPESFHVYRSADGQPDIEVQLPSSARSFTDGHVIAGVTYRYSVSASDVLGEGPRSEEASATPLAAVPPDAPTDLTATANFTATGETWSSGVWADVALQWSAPAVGAPDRYLVYRLSCPYLWPLSQCEDVNETEIVGRVPGGQTSFEDRVRDGDGGMSHHYWVAGIFDRTQGTLSNMATVSEPCTWC